MSPILEAGEAEKLLHCGPIRMRELLATGAYPAIKEGKEYVIPRDAFVAEMNARAVMQMHGRRKMPEVGEASNVVPIEKKKPGRRRVSLEAKLQV